MLRDLKTRGLKIGPKLAVGDGALGFWSALKQVYPEMTHQHSWFHKMGNVLAALPKSLQGKAKNDLQATWMPHTRQAAELAFDRFLSRYGAKNPTATENLVKDREALLAFFAFPGEDWVQLRTTSLIESRFAIVRHRATRTYVSRNTFLGLDFQIAEEAAKSWRRIRPQEEVAELLAGTRYKDGTPVPNDPPEQQREAAKFDALAPWSYTSLDPSSRAFFGAIPATVRSPASRRGWGRTSSSGDRCDLVG